MAYNSVPELLAAVERRFPNLRSVAAVPITEEALLEAMLEHRLVLMGETHCRDLSERNEERLLEALYRAGMEQTPAHPLDLGSEYTILKDIERRFPLMRRFFLPLPKIFQTDIRWMIKANTGCADEIARFLDDHRGDGVSPVVPVIVGIAHLDSPYHSIQRYLLERDIECLVIRFDEQYGRTGLFRHSPHLYTVGGRHHLFLKK